MKKILAPTMALVTLGALTLAGCGGSTSSSAPSSAAAPASSAASAPSAGDTSPAADPSTSDAGAKDPCKVLSASKVSELTGVEVSDSKGAGPSGSQLCSWAGGKPGTTSYVIFTGQEGAAVGGSMSEVGDQLQKQFGGQVSQATVAGADEAIYLSGTKSGLVIDVLAKRGDVFYQVVATAPGSQAEKYKDGIFKIVEALIAG